MFNYACEKGSTGEVFVLPNENRKKKKFIYRRFIGLYVAKGCKYSIDSNERRKFERIKMVIEKKTPLTSIKIVGLFQTY